jgi:uncharacterized phage protein (TIGR01671 family)
MREIKFRAWVEDGEERYMITQGEPDVETLFLFMFHYATEMTYKKITLMQYTGLHDKKGKEVYEKDILKPQYGGLLYVVPDLFEFGQFWAANADTVEVIGNIYENPELLGNEDKNRQTR